MARSVPHGFEYVSALGIRAHTTLELLKRLEAGVPFTCVERFQRRLALPMGEVAALLQIPPRTLTRRKSEGRLQPDESDRLLRASRLFQLATELFEGDTDLARAWFSAPKKALSGKPPLEFIRTEVGAREVENFIGRLEHGVYS